MLLRRLVNSFVKGALDLVMFFFFLDLIDFGDF